MKKTMGCKALAVRLLIDKFPKGVSMIDASAIYFHKFSTRLAEVERETSGNSMPLKISRVKVTKLNRYGHSMTFTKYIPKNTMRELIKIHDNLSEKYK